MANSDDEGVNSECVVAQHTVPSEIIRRYSPSRDPHSEADIARYVEIEADGERVKHVEKVKEEIVFGEAHEIWDVITDKNRWWVITNLTNLYSQQHFPSLDYTISFHIGLMARLRSRPIGASSIEPSPFDDIFRRSEQAKYRFDTATEAEDFQAIGVQLRECLLSLIAALRRRSTVDPLPESPQDANFIAWSAILVDQVCPGSRNKELRQYLKGTARDTWQLVNWLTHDRSANKTATGIAIHGCDTIVGHSIAVFERERVDHTDQCPLCNSRDIRRHFDPAIASDGDYFESCGKCGWDSHPGLTDLDDEAEQ